MCIKQTEQTGIRLPCAFCIKLVCFSKKKSRIIAAFFVLFTKLFDYDIDGLIFLADEIKRMLNSSVNTAKGTNRSLIKVFILNLSLNFYQSKIKNRQKPVFCIISMPKSLDYTDLLALLLACC